MEPETTSSATTEPEASRLASFALLIALGWLGTNLGLAIGELPLKFLLKDQLHQTAAGVAAFFAIGQFSNYINPVAVWCS
jgi:hypothetical protein